MYMISDSRHHVHTACWDHILRDIGMISLRVYFFLFMKKLCALCAAALSLSLITPVNAYAASEVSDASQVHFMMTKGTR